MPLRGFSASERTKYECRAGDILVVKSSGSAANIISGKAGYVRKDTPKFIFSNFLLRLRVSEIQYQSAFLYSLIISDLTRERVKQMCSTTTYPNLQVGMYSNAILPCPPYDEQIQIINFLDHETAKIDTLIHEQKRLIELLKEKRQALVLSAFSLSDSVETRLANAVNLIYKPVSQKVDETYIPIGLFNRGRGLFHKDPRGIEEMGESDFFWVNDGDLIISGQFAWEGAVALAGEKEQGKVVSHRYPILRGKNGIVTTEYIFALLTTRHGDFLLNENSRGAAGRNKPLNISALLKEKITIPAFSLQNKIVEIVHQERQIKAEASRQKKLLLEHRAALISAAVTGKIDVRGWQPPAYESAFDEEIRQAEIKVTA
jgi:type I restriction enzyme S subunit